MKETKKLFQGKEGVTQQEDLKYWSCEAILEKPKNDLGGLRKTKQKGLYLQIEKLEGADFKRRSTKGNTEGSLS